MKEFLHNNPTLAFGLGLPVLLVMVFTLAAGIPNITATPPKYDVIFATNYNDTGSIGYKINVVEGKIALAYVGECGYYMTPEIYRYQAASGSLKRIDFTIPPSSKKDCQNGQIDRSANNVITPLALPELAQVKLDNSNPAPDGYQFTFDNYYSNGGVLPFLFFSRGYSNEPVLQKGTYRVRLPLSKGYYTSSNVRFIGWVVAQ